MITRQRLAIVSGVLALAGVAIPTSASAQATRTWVSGVGDDANPCSRTAPCKTFAGAISKTASGGEINCLDPGGFGGVTITKPLAIVCDYTEGGILSAGAGVNGIVINLPLATDSVFLSGLDLNGAGNAQNGIRIIGVGVVHVQNSIIRNYRASNGQGMNVAPSGALQLTITNTTIDDNGTAGTGGGILVLPTGAGTAAVVIQNSRIDGNSGSGIAIQGATTLTLMDSNVSYNSINGIRSSNGNPTGRVGNTTFTGNGTGVAVSSGAILSYGTNRINANGTDGGFSGSIITPL